MKNPEKLVLHCANHHLSSTPSVRDALNQFRGNPENFNVRISEFDSVCQALIDVVSERKISTSDYYNCLMLKTELRDQPIPTLSQVINSQYRNPLRKGVSVFKEINLLIHSGKWEFPTQVKDPNQLVSGLLIEGYGLFLERLYEMPGLSRKFVLAFEEVLWNKFQGSNLLKDVLPWMIEENNSFSYGVKKGLEMKTLRDNDMPVIGLSASNTSRSVADFIRGLPILDDL